MTAHGERRVTINIDARGCSPEAVAALERSVIPKIRRMLNEGKRGGENGDK